jgi:hypothetical protein
LFILLFNQWNIYHSVAFSPFAEQLASHLLGLQVLLGSKMPPLFTLWFVGFIMLCYVAYACLSRFCLSLPGIILGAACVFCTALITKLLLGLFEDRFFLLFPVFMAGVVTNRLKPRSGRWVWSGLLLGAMGVALLGNWALWGIPSGHLDVRSTEHAQEALRVLYLCMCAVAMAIFLRGAAERIPAKAFRWILRASIASYAAYLFHRPILACLKWAMIEWWPIPPYAQDLGVLLLGIPGVLLASYGLGVAENSLVKEITRRIRGGRIAEPQD